MAILKMQYNSLYRKPAIARRFKDMNRDKIHDDNYGQGTTSVNVDRSGQVGLSLKSLQSVNS